MKTVSIMQAQHNLARLLREVEAGHELAITRRKKIVARLTPPPQEKKVVFPDFKTRARKTWKHEWRGAASEELVAQSRGER